MPDSEEYDLAMAPDADGTITLHTATCPVVRKIAAGGIIPVATMFGVKGPLPDDLPHHDCLSEVVRGRLARSWPG